MCPVLSSTPEVKSVIRWFDGTHDIEAGMGVTRWKRTTLPLPGSYSEQDAWLTEALDYVRHIHDDAMRVAHDEATARQAAQQQ